MSGIEIEHPGELLGRRLHLALFGQLAGAAHGLVQRLQLLARLGADPLRLRLKVDEAQRALGLAYGCRVVLVFQLARRQLDLGRDERLGEDADLLAGRARVGRRQLGRASQPEPGADARRRHDQQRPASAGSAERRFTGATRPERAATCTEPDVKARRSPEFRDPR